jgi:hypothetical protein
MAGKKADNGGKRRKNMSSQTKSYKIQRTPNPSLLKKSLLGNALFSGSSGLVLAIASSWLASFLGLESGAVIAGLGFVLILYAPFLAWLAFQEAIDSRLVWLVIDLDILWVIGSAVLVFSDLVPGLSIPGKWAIAIVADIVAVFAILQFLGLKRARE